MKDADIPESSFTNLYKELILTVRRLFHDCHLVHADLSEYNILYHVNSLYIIDVSQAVEHDHPHAFDFLRKDIGNVEEFFSRRGVKTLGLRRAFDLVTRDRQSLLSELQKEEQTTAENSSSNQSEADVLERWTALDQNEADGQEDQESNRTDGDVTRLREHEDAVFKRSFIPRNLNQVYDPERDVDILTRGGRSELIYSDTIGLVSSSSTSKEAAGLVEVGDAPNDLSMPPVAGVRFDCNSPSEDDGDAGGNSNTSDSDSSGDDGEGEVAREKGERPFRGHRHEDKESKKERKRAVKAEQAERRQHKIKKSVKKRLVKASSSKR